MTQCPLCHAPVKDDFGLQECAGCGAQLLVHMDGHVEYKGADRVEAVDDENDLKTVARVSQQKEETFSSPEPVFDLDESAPPPVPEESPDLVPPQDSEDVYQMPEEEGNSQPEPNNFVIGGVEEDVPHEAPPELFEDDRTTVSASEEPAEAPPHEATTFDFDTPPDGPEPEATPPPDVYRSAASPSSPDLSDIAAFGNSEISGGRDGTLRYNIIIEGIDTADVREAFREAITDRKFVWDIDQILRSVRNGKVSIQNVAPTKGYILVTRLRGLPLKIRWEQYAIQQT